VLDPVLIELAPSETDTVGRATILNVVDFVPDPALLLQVIVYVRVPAVEITPVLVLPLAPGEVTQLEVVPPAVQDVGLLVALQLTVAELPVLIDAGETEIVTTGAETAGVPEPTFKVVCAVLLVPPAFEHLKV